MTLHVSFDEFAETAKRVLGASEAYVAPSHSGTYVTAAHKTEDKIVSTISCFSVKQTKAKLEKAGMTLHEGAWSMDGEPPTHLADLSHVYIAAVSYESSAETPGIWIDAYDAPPAPVQVLKSLYEEFRENGEMPEVSFEEFIRAAKPNVAVATPGEIASYLAAKQQKDPSV